MKIAFLGDSITNGAGADKYEDCYVELVGKRLHCKVLNYGIGGTRIARQRKLAGDISDEDFIMRLEKMDPDADFVFVFGGTNDYGHGDAPIGEPGSRDVYTFYGALNVLVENLIEKYSVNRICFILPLHRFKEDDPFGENGIKKEKSVSLSAYKEIMRRVLDEKNIEYIDFDSEFPIPATASGDGLTIDGLHPNQKGHNIIADGLCKYIESIRYRSSFSNKNGRTYKPIWRRM